jgi:hypothetical protein
MRHDEEYYLAHAAAQVHEDGKDELLFNLLFDLAKNGNLDKKMCEDLTLYLPDYGEPIDFRQTLHDFLHGLYESHFDA